MKSIINLISYRVGDILAKEFGISDRSRKVLFGNWLLVLALILTSFIIIHLSQVGCIYGRACTLPKITGSELLAFLIAIFGVAWSVGIAIGQKEQSADLKKLVKAEQQFSKELLSPLAKIDNHFHEFSTKDRDLTFQIYVSSPAFGILGGSQGLNHFATLFERFVDAAGRRAGGRLKTGLDMFLWDPDSHLKVFRHDLASPKQFWNASTEEWQQICAGINRICSSLAKISEINRECDGEHWLDDWVQFRLFHVPADECRFFLLEGSHTQNAAMMTIAPIAEAPDADLPCILLTDYAPGGVAQMRRFANAFTQRVAGTGHLRNEARVRGMEVSSDPRDLFKRYFGHDFSDPAVRP